MKFIYVGEELKTDCFGLTFPKGVSVEVADAHAVKKLTNNSQFRHYTTADVDEEVPSPPAREEGPFFKRKGRK